MPSAEQGHVAGGGVLARHVARAEPLPPLVIVREALSGLFGRIPVAGEDIGAADEEFTVAAGRSRLARLFTIRMETPGRRLPTLPGTRSPAYGLLRFMPVSVMP